MLVEDEDEDIIYAEDENMGQQQSSTKGKEPMRPTPRAIADNAAVVPSRSEKEEEYRYLQKADRANRKKETVKTRRSLQRSD